MRREPWGTGSDSILWYMQVWRFISNVLGILLLWVGILYTHKYSQKHKCFLLFYIVHLEGSYSYDTHTYLYIVSLTISLDVTLKPFRKVFVQSFPYWTPLPVILSKIFFGFPWPPIPYFSMRDKWLLILVGGNPFNLYYNIRIK